MELLAGEMLETRLRPVRRSRLRQAAPGLWLSGWGLVLALSAWTSGPLAGAAPLVVAALVAVAGASGAVLARFARTATFPPVLAAAAVAAVTLGLEWRGAGGPALLLLVGVLWAGIVEALRAGTTLELTTHGLIIQTGWHSRPVRLRYAEIRGVEGHTKGAAAWGTLALETEHGLMPIPGLPAVKRLELRILTRIQSGEPSPQVEAAIGVASRVKTLLGA